MAGPVQVIGFTGMPGSGKSEAMAVATARGFPVIRMGDLIWEEVERRGLERSSAHVGPVANELRETHGPAVWAERTAKRILEAHADAAVVLVDGVRSMAEVEAFRDRLGDDFHLVAIHTDRRQRFQRMTQRAREDDPDEESGHAERDQREMGWGLARTVALADEMLVNDGSLEEFRTEVAELLDRLAR